jgi:hypothetical protein
MGGPSQRALNMGGFPHTRSIFFSPSGSQTGAGERPFRGTVSSIASLCRGRVWAIPMPFSALSPADMGAPLARRSNDLQIRPVQDREMNWSASPFSHVKLLDSKKL